MPVWARLLPNLDRGKTEFVASPIGKGSRKCQLGADTSCPMPPMESGICVTGPDPTYQHLGRFIHHDASLIRELCHRVGLARKVFNSRKKRVSGSAAVAKEDKIVLCESLSCPSSRMEPSRMERARQNLEL